MALSMAMITSAHDSADDDADNQSGDNRVTLLIHQSPDRSACFFEFCNQAAVSYARTDHNQRPAGSPDIAATVDCLTDITTINHMVKRHAP